MSSLKEVKWIKESLSKESYGDCAEEILESFVARNNLTKAPDFSNILVDHVIEELVLRISEKVSKLMCYEKSIEEKESEILKTQELFDIFYKQSEVVGSLKSIVRRIEQIEDLKAAKQVEEVL